MEKQVKRIFVYGTLDKIPIFLELVNKEKIKYVGRGKIRARLYDLGEYPGAIEDTRSYVHGKVYEISSLDEILPIFDEYEEFYPDKLENSVFIRKVKKVVMENNESIRAFVYIYNKSVKSANEIPTGIWKK